VRIPRELIDPLEKLVENTKDEYGIAKFRGVSSAVAEAVKDLLKKYATMEANAR
jgi:Arc/MetJ-type ribon-helix-helix transcriptional regulator